DEVVLAPIRDSANDEARSVWAAFESTVQAFQKPFVPIRLDGVTEDQASPEKKGGHIFGPMLAMIVILMAMTGAFYPALDVAAGEKERGTLETLLLTPASRLELVAGKYLTVLAVALVAALMNLASMALTLSRLPSLMGGDRAGMPALSISPTAFLVILLGLIIMASLFSAVCLALSTFARTYKEGQAYLTPAMLVVMPLSMVAMLPDMNLDRSMAIVPVANMALLMKGLLVGAVPLMETVLTLGINLILSLAALVWTAGLFSREEVLFREGRQVFGLKPPIGVPRPSRPSLPAALLGMCLGLVWMVQAGSIFLHQGIIVLIAAPLLGLLVIALLLTRLSMAPLKSGLGLDVPTQKGWLAGACLGVGGLALSLSIGALQQEFMSGSKDVAKAMEAMLEPIFAMPLPAVLLLLAVLPAVCEEFLYRGLVLQGARSALGDRGAVILSGLVFALMHNITDPGFHRLFPQAALGVLLGMLVIRTGSLWPAVLAHALHNGVIVALSSNPDDAIEADLGMLLLTIPVAATLLVLAFALTRRRQTAPPEDAIS
ncbi:MAG TPA: ABC transporter permease subunit/CPBP intramembrane protease, partial [Planctomycetota bacterium]|nr:ABC transporter permease subunit/CPBP intramembrane protease [Planctomycetota bacterium]